MYIIYSISNVVEPNFFCRPQANNTTNFIIVWKFMVYFCENSDHSGSFSVMYIVPTFKINEIIPIVRLFEQSTEIKYSTAGRPVILSASWAKRQYKSSGQ